MKTSNQTILGEALDLTQSRVEADREFRASTKILVARYSASRQFRHLRVMEDSKGFYVRTGKRGAHKRHLADMAGARIVDRKNRVVVFFEIGE